MKLKTWLTDIDDKGLFGWRTSYILLRPHKLAIEIWLRIKWAYQRVFRGWDDRVIWSVDWWMADIMPEVLATLMVKKHGTPFMAFDGEPDEKGEYTDKQMNDAKEKYDNEIRKMIRGFQAAHLIHEGVTAEEEKILTRTFEIGMKSFVKYFFTLWD